MDNSTIKIIYSYQDYTPSTNIKVDGMNTLKRYKQYLLREYNKEKTITSYYSSAKHLLEYTQGDLEENTLLNYKQQLLE